MARFPGGGQAAAARAITGTLHLGYQTAGLPTYGSLATEEQDPQLLIAAA